MSDLLPEAVVYLLHFSRPYPGGQNPQHYLGVSRAETFDDRMEEHSSGSSKSKLTRACHEKGIVVQCVKFWEFATPREAFDHERAVKAKKASYARMCPLCQEKS